MALAVHRRTQPVASKICAKEWHKRDLEMHHSKLGNMTHHIDVSPPKTYYYSLNRSKREQQMEEKYSRMEKENQMLLAKMHWIMSHPSPTVDHKSEVFQYSHDAQGRPRSLNSVSRKKELRRIMADNQSILKRIQNRKAFYNRKDWDDHATAHEQYLENLREKPLPRLSSAPPRRRRVPQLAPLSPQPPGAEAKGEDGKRRIGGGSGFAATTPSSSIPAVAGGSASLKNAFAKEGRRIDGHYVIVYVDELPAPDDALYFRTYDVDAGTEDGVKVPWTVIRTLVTDTALLEATRREELATSLLPRLRFKDGALSFDTSEGGATGGSGSESKGEAKKISVEEATKLAPASAAAAPSAASSELPPPATHAESMPAPSSASPTITVAAPPAAAATTTTSSSSSRPTTGKSLAPPRPTTSSNASPRNEYADDAFDDPTPQPTPQLANRSSAAAAPAANTTSPPLTAAPAEPAAPSTAPTHRSTASVTATPATATATTDSTPPKSEPAAAATTTTAVTENKDEPKANSSKPASPRTTAPSSTEATKEPEKEKEKVATPRDAAPAAAAAATSVDQPSDKEPEKEKAKDGDAAAPAKEGGEYEDDFS